GPQKSGTSGTQHSLSFDGSDDYVTLNDETIPSSNNYSLEFWVNRTGWNSYSNYNAILGWGNSGSPKFQVSYKNSSGTFYFGGWGTDYDTGIQFDLNTWYHVTVSVTNNFAEMYINATDTEMNKDVSQVIRSNFYFGRTIEQNLNLHSFIGLLDEVRLWNTALTQEEIQSHMSTELTGSETGLDGYWNFNEGSGTTLTDQTSNGNDGTIVGATWDDDVPTLTTSSPSTVLDIVTTNSYTASNLLEDVMYYWKIVAVDDDGGTKESSTWSFWMNGENSPPSEFSLVEPLNNAVLNIFNPPFCWEESTDPDIDDQVNYILVLGEHIDSLTIIYNGPYMESCFSETMGFVEDNTVYYWKVTAVDLSGATTENNGGYHSFIINTENDPPTSSTLVAPLNESIQTDLTPNFYWTEAIDPDPMDHVSYTMRWWPMGVLPVIYSANTDSNSFTPEENLTDNSQ
ncbi:uncharacterized protein METZ01_LOCUS245695, partial [marine metagenome]